MAHPYQQYREKHPGQKKAKERVSRRASGGATSADASIGRKAISLHAAEHKELKAEGKKSGGRLDKYARGGKTKGKGGKKGNNTKINIMVAPKVGNEAPPPVPPTDLGAAPPPMPPKMPLGPPAGGPMGAPMGGPPMKRGGKVGMKAGADSGEGRLQKAKAYKR